jgi:hypothetical protein
MRFFCQILTRNEVIRNRIFCQIYKTRLRIILKSMEAFLKMIAYGRESYQEAK